jgi:hypothetical protein
VRDTADYDSRKLLLSIVTAVSLAAHTRLNAIERELGLALKQVQLSPRIRMINAQNEGNIDELLCPESAYSEVLTGTVILSQAAYSHAPGSLYLSLSTLLGGVPTFCIA